MYSNEEVLIVAKEIKDIEKKIKQILAEHLKFPIEEIGLNSLLVKELGMDSFEVEISTL